LTRLRNEKIISIENNRLIIVLDLRRLKARAGNS
jgi:CRP/FNR family transcriptional regulator